jgi:hypothetical protein
MLGPVTSFPVLLLLQDGLEVSKVFLEYDSFHARLVGRKTSSSSWLLTDPKLLVVCSSCEEMTSH